MNWTTAAWHGIALDIPADWSLVGVSGDEKKGSMRIDSPIASAVEVRWSSAAGKPPDLMAKGRELLSNMERGSRKKKIKFTSKIREEGDGVTFEWKGDRIGHGRLLCCKQCDRVIVAQVVSAREENVSQVVQTTLGSIRDHRDDGWTDWGLYGLVFAVPKGFRIHKHVLMSGYLSLIFRGRMRSLIIERWGLAETLIGSNDLKTWYKKDVQPDVKGFRFGVAEGEVHEHEGLVVTGRAAGIKQLAKAAALALTLYSNPSRFTGYAWHCKESNRLFSVRASHAPDEQIAEPVRDLIQCH